MGGSREHQPGAIPTELALLEEKAFSKHVEIFQFIQGCILPAHLNFSHSQAANEEEPGEGRVQELMRCSRYPGDTSGP